LTEIEISGIVTCYPFSSRSGFKSPASMWMKVDFPVPFSPKSTTISDWLNEPPSISTLKVLNVFVKDGYSTVWPYVYFSINSVSFFESPATLKLSSSSQNLVFSVGINPAKNTLIPSLTEKGRVTTPYAPGTPYNTQVKSDK